MLSSAVNHRVAADLTHGYTESNVTEYGYTTIFEPLPEGGFSVLVPAIPEICTFGETLEEAREMALDAIRCFLESAAPTREPLPPA